MKQREGERERERGREGGAFRERNGFWKELDCNEQTIARTNNTENKTGTERTFRMLTVIRSGGSECINV